MELSVQCWDKDFVIEVGDDDTTATLRKKVATATGLCEDSFHMGFGGKYEGEDITELSAGDKIVLTKTTKYEAIAALHALGETDITEKRLKEVTDPKVASLLLQAEVVAGIPNGFFFESATVTRIGSNCVSMDDVHDTSLPDTKLDLPALPFITAIRGSFLPMSTTLSCVDLTGLQAVTSIGDGFLTGCEALLTVDLTGLTSVTSIGDDFIAHCLILSRANLTGLKAVTSIGHNFLSYCLELSQVDLSGLQAVTSIGDGFLANSFALSTVDLTGMKSVDTIGNMFLSNCPELMLVDLRGMKATSVGRALSGYNQSLGLEVSW